MGYRVRAFARLFAFIALVVLAFPASSFAWHWPKIDPILLFPGEPMKVVIIDMPDFGLDTRNAVDLAVEQFGKKIDGHMIRTQAYPFGCDEEVEGNDRFLKRVTRNDRVVGVIGPICSGVASRQVPILSAAGILTISPANTTADFSTPEFHEENRYYFRTAPSDLIQGTIDGSFASTPVAQGGLGASRAAILYYPDESYPESLRASFKQTFAGTVVGEFPVSFDQEDFSAVIAQMEALNVDVVYAPIFENLTFFFEQLRGGNGAVRGVPVFATDGFFGDFIFEVFGDNPEELYLSTVNSEGPHFVAFYNDYVAKYGIEPNPFEGFAYDATRLLLKAVADKSFRVGKFLFLDPRSLVAYMEDGIHYPYNGAGGVYSTPTGADLNSKGFSVYKAENGDFTPLYP